VEINPRHYTDLNPQPIDVMLAWRMPYLDASVLKYLSRWRKKNGLEDLYKAQWFLNKLIEYTESEDSDAAAFFPTS
jgi:hypothetical protein